MLHTKLKKKHTNTLKTTRQGSGRCSKPKADKKTYRGQGKR